MKIARFDLVFSRLREALQEGTPRKTPNVMVMIRKGPDAPIEELDEIDNLRRIVLEVTEPEPISITTT